MNAREKWISNPENRQKQRDWAKRYSSNLRRRYKEYRKLNKLRAENKLTAKEHSNLIISVK